MLTVIQGDCRDRLRELADESVHCVVTSPPYWGLRDYGTARWEGGHDDCGHKAPPRSSTIIKGNAANKTGPNQTEQFGEQFRRDCETCGARRIDSQLGLEQSPEEYVAAMVGVFREVRRVLRGDGTLWLNLGSSYAGSWGAMSHDLEGKAKRTGTNARPPTSFFGKRPIQPQNDVPAYGSDGITLQDSLPAGRACPDCGDELIACSLNRRDRNAGTFRQNGQSELQPLPITHDSEQRDSVSSSRRVSSVSVPDSTNVSLEENAQDVCGHEVQALASQSNSPTSFGGDPRNEYNSAYISGTAQNGHPSFAHRSGTAYVCMACGYSTRMYPTFKPLA